MTPYIKFNRKVFEVIPNQYEFEIVLNEDGTDSVFFTVYNDLSGYKFKYAFNNPFIMVMCGIAIMENKDSIKNTVQNNRFTKNPAKEKC